mmetsp:Transcript_5963/g.6561  ORF Transcript_5963/g.6561 Transcript_5963/m.6561 type:complete len:138 (-) Transcript_5963:352-765(-)|eukprot:gene5373-5758_t
MAARVIAQLIVNGAAIFSRAFYTAYQQAIRNAKAGGATQAAKTASRLKMRPDEALKILSMEKHELNNKALIEKYTKLFDLNDPTKGGSFYLQSKIYRSKEVLEKVLEEESGGGPDEDKAKATEGESTNDADNPTKKE